MSADVEDRLRSGYGHLVPDAECEAGLLSALSTAPQEAAPPRGAWMRRLLVPLAASLLVAGAWWWGSHSTEGPEAPAGPGDAAAAPPTITVVLHADGTARVTTHETAGAGGAGSEQTIAVAGNALAELEGTLGASLGADFGFKEIAKTAAGLAFTAPRAPDGTSTARLVVSAEATVPWRWVAWTMMAALPAQIVDVVFTSPADPKVTIAQPLPKDAGVGGGKPTVVWRVVLKLTDDSSCDQLSSMGVDVVVHVGSGTTPLIRAGLLHEGGFVPGVTVRPDGKIPILDERIARRRATLDALSVAAREAVALAQARGARITSEIDAPPVNGACVPYGAVFDVLSTLKAAGIETVHFVGSAPPTRDPRAAPPTSAAAPSAPAPPRVPEAPDAPVPPRPSVAGLDEKKVRGLDFEDVPMASVATYLRTVSGFSIAVTPKATALDVKVRLKLLTDVTVRQVLDLVTLPYGLQWALRDGMVVISAHDEGDSAGK